MSWRSIFIDDDSAWPGLGFNPAKGDLEALEHLTSDVKGVGDELDDLEGLLTSIGKRGGAWEGEAAERFSKELGDLPKYLRQGTESMHDCAKALRTWHGKLQDFQSDAVRLESDAVEARHQAEHKAHHYNSLVNKYAGKTMPADQAQRAETEMHNAQSDWERVNGHLQDIIREGERIYANWKDRAGEAERAILKASENHPPDLSIWGRITDNLQEAWRSFKEWLINNADTLSTISSALALAAIAVNAIPVVGQAASVVLGVASGVCAAGAMAGHWMDNARGGGTPGWKVGLDALGVIPLVGGPVKSGVAVAKQSIKFLPKAAEGAEAVRFLPQTAKEIQAGIESPISSKLIQKSLSKVFPAVTEAKQGTITMVSKGISVAHGIEHQLFGEDSTQQATGAKNANFQKALAA
jgi:uncharacterized protein YukE